MEIKKLFISASVAAALMGGLASCNETLDVIAENSKDVEVREAYEAAVAQYNANFEASFGKISPDNNWGFDPIPFLDAESLTRTNVNFNQWVSDFHLDVPGGLETSEQIWGWAKGDVTQYERAYVYWWFSTHQWPKTISVDWQNYFIENVWGQPEHSGFYSDGTSYTYTGTEFGMDFLSRIKSDQTQAHSPYYNYISSENDAMTYYVSDLSQYDHLNDYNDAGQHKEQVIYEYDSSTRDFYYKASFANQEEEHNNWTLQYINGNYYLAFDYWHEKLNDGDTFAKIDADGYYNDWILKLQPGTRFHKDAFSRRIMCEDLGNSFDWDFNDVVFDVMPVNDNSTYGAVVITLQAAGGTLPIYVGDMAHEAHAMFGVATTQPVNVASGCKRPAVVFNLPVKEEWTIEDNGVRKLDFEKIPVFVDHGTNVMANGEGSKFKLNAGTGNAPHKIACPTNTYWLKELKEFYKTYDPFKQWVNGQITGDSWCITSTQNQSAKTDDHYDDYGQPTSESYAPTDGTQWNDTQIRPWKDLWDAADKNATAYTQERTYTNPAGQNETVTFIGEAPYIYTNTHDGANTIAHSPYAMSSVFEYYRSQGNDYELNLVWPSGTTYKVALTAEGPGNVTGSGTYLAGKNVTITATPNWGDYTFKQWSDGDLNPTRTILIDKNYTLSAIFSESVTLTMNKSGYGYVTVAGGVASSDMRMYSENETKHIAKDVVITLTPVPDSGWHFVKWEDDSTDNPRSITMSENKSVRAVFEQDQAGARTR